MGMQKNCVNILYLPEHSCHVSQPLDLGTFSPLKSRYRKEIPDLAYLDDAAPVKKGRLIQTHQKSRTETFTPRTLRAGWAAAGLFHWNQNKTLNSSRLHKTNSSKSINPTPPSPNPPSTPTKRKRTGSLDNSNISELRNILETFMNQ
jgi:hypothetical protein